MCVITLVNHCSRTLLFCLCDEVAIDATSLIDRLCYSIKLPVDGKAAVATQAQAVVLSYQWKKVMLSHRIQKGDEE